MTKNKIDIINDIITKNRFYGKNLTNQRIKISILSDNISISNLIYIDSLSRVLSLSTEVDTDYLINSDDCLKIKKDLDKIRINFNKVINTKDITQNIEDLLDYLRYHSKCYIENNNLCLDNCQLVDSEGNYTNILEKVNYLKTVSDTYNWIFTIDNNYNSYSPLLKELSISNITNLTFPIIKDINSYESIDKLRIEALSLNQNFDDIKTIYQKINTLLNSYRPNILNSYDTLITDIEENLITILDNYNNIIMKVCHKLDLNDLITYIDILINNIEQYINIINNNKNLNNEQLNLLEALKIILNNSLDLLGIIPIYL